MSNYTVINERPSVNSVVGYDSSMMFNQSIPLNIGCIVEEGTSYDITKGDMVCNTLGCTNVMRYKQPYCASDDVLCPGRYKERMDGGSISNGLLGPIKPLTGMQLLIFMVVVVLFLTLLTQPIMSSNKNKNKKEHIVHHIGSDTESPVGGFPPCLRDETYTYL
jgi:hypothetical protein